MGTRHYQMVIDKEGVTKVAQYGQWDGYPSGQGVNILQYFKTGNLDAYLGNLAVVREITSEEIEKVDNTPNWANEYPHLSRDCGYRIHSLIESGKVPFVSFCTQEEADKWCEGFYTIDFRNNTFHSKFYDREATFSLENLPSEEEYLKIMEPTEED